MNRINISEIGDLPKDNNPLSAMVEELKRSKDAAETEAASKSEFLANMCHEIRTPMNAVIGSAGLLLDTNPTDEQRMLIETIKTSGDALLSVVNDILDLTKIDSCKLVIEKKAFDLESCIKDSLNLVALSAYEKGLNLSYGINENTPRMISGDPIRLRQVMVNLLNNAVKFTEKGKVLLSVSCKNNCNSHEINFEVKDTGIGIAENKIKDLFQSFSQADASTTRKYGGTGLGLAISKRLVELMGGKIWVESVLGQGSTFYFTVLSDPVDDRLTEAKEPSDHKKIELAKEQGQSLNILIAEDNLVNQMVMQLMLERMGHKVDVAASGLEVLNALEHSSYDIILMDVQMPEMDGLEATRIIRQRWPNCDLKIIAITAYALNGDREMCLQAGMDDYISKPVQYNDLVKALKSYE